MNDNGEWIPIGGVAGELSEARRRYVEYLRAVHGEIAFRLALADEMVGSAEDVERLLFEAEMLANYGVA